MLVISASSRIISLRDWAFCPLDYIGYVGRLEVRSSIARCVIIRDY
jgi:hypothetical protein